MRLLRKMLRTLSRSWRALAAPLLLSAFAVGASADAWHHLSEQCASDQGGRADHCVCASLHAAPFASEGVAQATPVECEREVAPAFEAIAPLACAAHAAAPRAPPRG